MDNGHQKCLKPLARLSLMSATFKTMQSTNGFMSWHYRMRQKKFQVHVTIKNAMGETVNDYYEQARSMVESHDLIIEDERCFSLGIKKAKRYAMKDTNQVDYTVTIRNLKDEGKGEDEESGIDD